MELLGHAKIETTQIYMSLSKGATEATIRLLEDPAPAWSVEK